MRRNTKKTKEEIVEWLNIKVYINKDGVLNYKVESVPAREWKLAVEALPKAKQDEVNFYTDLFNVMWDIAHDAQKKLGRFIG